MSPQVMIEGDPQLAYVTQEVGEGWQNPFLQRVPAPQTPPFRHESPGPMGAAHTFLPLHARPSLHSVSCWQAAPAPPSGWQALLASQNASAVQAAYWQLMPRATMGWHTCATQ